jgi:hypothetical protein
MANQWFKFYGAEYLSDPKMDRLTVQERSCWLTLLCMASQTDGVVKYISIEGLLNKSGVRFNPYDTTEWENAQSVLKTFEQYEMIIVQKNGAIQIKNWETRQERNQTGAERQAKYREKKKSNEKVTKRVTKVTLEENRIEENRIESNTETSSEDINLLIKSFETLNPASKKFYGIPTQRKACASLIKDYGFERVQSVVEKTLPKTNGLQFFPTITTPLQLQDKWVTLESAIRKYQSEKKTITNKYPKI